MKKLLIALAIIIALTIHFYFMATDWLYRDCVSYYFDLVGSFLYLLISTFFILLFFGGILGMWLVIRYMIFEKGKDWRERTFGFLLVWAFVGVSFVGALDGVKKMLMHSHADMHEIAEDCEYKEQGKCLSWKKYRYSEYTTDE